MLVRRGEVRRAFERLSSPHRRSARLPQMLEASLQGAGNGAVQQEQFARQAELHLKFVRQIDRLARLTRQPSAKAPEKPT